MKLLMIVHGFPPECSGGTESYLLRVSSALQARGHELHVLCGSHEGAGPDHSGPRVERTQHLGLDVTRVHRSGLFVDNWEKSLAPEMRPVLEELIAEFHPDLVHVHHWIRLSRDLISICHDQGVPALATLHDLSATCPRAFRIREEGFCTRDSNAENCFGCAPAGEAVLEEEQRLELELFSKDYANELRLARRLIVPSIAHRDLVLEHHPDCAGRFRVVPHGNISPIRRVQREPGGFPKEKLRIAHWGHLSGLKGIDVLLEAIAGASFQDRVTVDIFGKLIYPEEKKAMEALAKDLPVTWHGPYEPLQLVDHPMDLAIIPSRCSESWSFVLDEAFLLGVPVIASRIGALAERVGAAGTTFEAGSAAALREALETLFAAPDLLDRWRAAIPTLPTVDQHVDGLESVYHEVRISQAKLPRTPEGLREERLRVKTRQLELRNRVREQDRARGDRLRRDLDAAQKTLQEMDHYHREKDKVIATLRQSQEELEQIRSGQLQEAEAAIAERDRLREDHAALHEELEKLRETTLRLRGDAEETAAADQRVSARRALRERRRRERVEGSARSAFLEIKELRKLLSATHQRELELRAQVESLTERIAREDQNERALLGSLEEGASQLYGALERCHSRAERILALEPRWEELGAGAKDGESDVPLQDWILEDPAQGGEREEMREQLPLFLATAAQAQEVLTELIERRDRLIRRLGATVEGLAENTSRLERKRHNDTSARTAPRTPGTRLKVLFVVHQFLPRHVAGTEVYTHRLAKELSRDHDVVILTAESDHSRPRFEHTKHRFDGLRIHQVIHNYSWPHFRDTYDCPEVDAIFRSVLREERPDIVHIQHLHYWSSNFVTIASKRGIPVVHTLHDFMHLCPRDGQLRREDGELCKGPVPDKCADCIAHFDLGTPPPLMPRALRPGVDALIPPEVAHALRASREEDEDHSEHRRAAAERLEYLEKVLSDVDLFISPSDFLRQTFIESGMVSPERIITSDNGIDHGLFPKSRPRGPIADQGKLRVGYVGSIAVHKGLDVLVDAMNGIEDPRVSCAIWGEPKAFVEYTAQLRQRIQRDNTLLMGPFPPQRIREVLQSLDVLVVPSLWWENSPLTIHEAALCGVPVICSDIGGMKEYVKDGVTGLHFKMGDADDLRAKIQSLIDGKALANFDPDALEVKTIQADAKTMEERYRQLLARAAQLQGS